VVRGRAGEGWKGRDQRRMKWTQGVALGPPSFTNAGVNGARPFLTIRVPRRDGERTEGEGKPIIRQECKSGRNRRGNAGVRQKKGGVGSRSKENHYHYSAEEGTGRKGGRVGGGISSPGRVT